MKDKNENFSIFLGKYKKDYEKKLEQLNKEKIIERIWKKDYTVWSNKPDEIINRLGWLKSPGVTLAAIE